MGFRRPHEAVEYAKTNRVALAILDIELGTTNGMDLCHTLHEINPRTNIIFLTAYADYSLDAWETEACGFILKPLTAEGLKKQLKKLHYPLTTGKTGFGSEIIVADNGRGFAPDDDCGLHIALENIQKRLEIMCRGRLVVTKGDNGGTVVTVAIPDSAAK